MEQIFLTVLNMSITAVWMILAVLLLRLPLKNAPKTVSVALWGLVALRLMFPFRVESALSLIPSAEPIPRGIELARAPAIASGIPAVDQSVNPALAAAFTPDPVASVNPLQIVTAVASRVWLVGIGVLLIYCAVSYFKLRGRVRAAVPFRGNIFECDAIASPFVLGVLRPKIYLPFGMEERDRELVIAHEEAHIRRGDHRIKLLGFLLLAVHWFNPAVWLAYFLLCRDVELACDERVIKTLGEAEKRAYSSALLSCSTRRARIGACPVAFGEGDVRGRIKNILHYKKPAFWALAAAAVACAVLAACFLTNPREEDGVISIKENDFSSGGSAEAAISEALGAEAAIFDHQFAEPSDGLDPTKTFCFAGYSTGSAYGFAVFQRGEEGSFTLLKTADSTAMTVQNGDAAAGYYGDYWIFVCMDETIKEIRFSGDIDDTIPVDRCPSIAVVPFFSRIPEGGGAQFAFYDAEGNAGFGGSYGSAEVEIFPCYAVADYPAVYDIFVEETVLGTEDDAVRLREFLKNLNGDQVSLMACSSGPWDFTENHRKIGAADSVLLLRYLRSLTDFTVYDQWENPATGGSWSVYLETANDTWLIGSPGEWLMATYSGPEGNNKTYVFDAAGAEGICNNIGGIIGAYLGAPEEFSDEEMTRIQAAVNDMLAQYRAGTVDTSVPEASEHRFEPLPARCPLPEYVTVGTMTVNLGGGDMGGYHVQLYAQNALYVINLRVNILASSVTGEMDYVVSSVSFQTIAPEIVRQQLLAEDALRMEVESCEVDEAETRRVTEMYKGSDLAKSRGWSDEMLENRFVVIRAVYDASYDHTKTFRMDGRQEAYFYLADPENTGVYTVVDSTTPNLLPEPD